MKKTAMVVLVLVAMFIMSGCYVESDVKIDAKDNVQLSQMLISMDAGEEVVESSVRHAMNIMGIRDSFEIKKHKPQNMAMEEYLLITPTKPMFVNKTSTSGDKITITAVGAQKKLEWLLEPRVQVFANKLTDGDSEDMNKVFLVIRIAFPSAVDMANTSESSENIYIWRITKAQMAKQFKISAVYATPK